MNQGTWMNGGESVLKITVVLCTYNRCQSLAKALESVAASQLPDTVEWEVVVVDNHSTDQTREVVEAFCRRYPGRFRYLYEQQQGLSFARNAGVRQARGEIIAFTDDDLTVEPTWLWSLTGALGNGEWAGAGGRILPSEVFSLPPWLALDGPYGLAGPLYAGFDMGDHAHELDRPPHGACMAFRKSAFDKYGDFRTDLGASPGSALGNEDTEFGRRLMVGGERLRYEPSAVVYHQISKNRVSKEFFLNWWFDFGRAQVREAGKRPAIWGIPRHYITIPNVILTHLPKRTFHWLVALSPQKRFYRKCMVCIVAGWLVETRRLARLTKPVAVPSTQQDKREAST
jgi:glycosyltransferase involved in cell wall biosynthesis